MLRLLEGALLLLIPFMVYATWRAAASDGGPSVRVLATTGATVALLLGLLFWHAYADRLPSGGVYVPPRIEDGRILPATSAEPK